MMRVDRDNAKKPLFLYVETSPQIVSKYYRNFHRAEAQYRATDYLVLEDRRTFQG